MKWFLKDWFLCSLFFCWAAFVALMVQFVLLPHVFPQFHEGSGLLKNHDAHTFHECALEVNSRLQHQGWSSWRLRPWLGNFQPAAIAGIFYHYIAPKPWSVIPYNALLHALSGLLLIKIFELFTGRKKYAVLAACPFVFFPSALTWYAQIHRDGIYFFGLFLSLYALMRLLLLLRIHGFTWQHVACFLGFTLGSFCLWLGRDYTSVLLLLVVFGFSVLVACFALRRYLLVGHFQHGFKWLAMCIAMGAVNLLWDSWQFAGDQLPEPVSSPEAKQVSNESTSNAKVIEFDQEKLAEAEKIKPAHTAPRRAWQDAQSIPNVIENRFYTIASARDVYLEQFKFAGSLIDTDVRFYSLKEVLLYIPRALQIGLMAPFPNSWWSPGTRPSGGMERKLAAGEMLIVYACLLALLLSVWRWWRFDRFYLLLSTSIIFILPFALTVVGVGTLYRMRYGPLMLLVGLGVLSLLHCWEWFVRKLKRAEL